MIDQRRLRFSDIVGLGRPDLPLACEIWLDDIYRAPWITREAMKLSAYFVRYMNRPDANALTLREIESQCQLSADDVRKALVLMRGFGAVEAFVIDRNDIRVGLCLGYLQRLRALEAKHRFTQLPVDAGASPWPWEAAEDKWLPGGGSAAGGKSTEIKATPVPAGTAIPKENGGSPKPPPPSQIAVAPKANGSVDADL